MAASPKTSPATQCAAVTPHDTNANVFRALYVGGAGDVAVVLADDTAAVTFSAVPAGTVLPLATAKVMATNTTATLIVGLK